MKIPFSVLSCTAIASFIVTNLSCFTALAQAEQQVCVVTDDGATACGRVINPKEEANEQTQISEQREEIDNIVFSLKGCMQSERTLKCEFTVTNKGPDVTVQFPVVNWAGQLSKIVDSKGTVYRSNSVDIDSQRPDGNGTIVTTLVSKVNYVATITFENIPDQLDSIQLFDVSVNTSKHPQFRNISLAN